MRSLLNILSGEEVEHIHRASLQILYETGVKINSSKVTKLLAQSGARVSGNNVRIPEELVQEAIDCAPVEVLLAARNPEYDIIIPGNEFPLVAPGGYAPFVNDWETVKRRPSTGDDLREFARLADYLDTVSFFWPTVMPTEVPDRYDEIYALAIALENTGKHVQCSCSSETAARWQLEIGYALAGGEEELRKRPVFSALGSPISPLCFDQQTVEAMVIIADAGIPAVPMNMALASTTAPVTMAGTLAVINAEQLAALLIIQTVRPGSPMIYATDSPPASARTGNPNFLAPEYPLIAAGCSQMAKFYGLPSMVGHGPVDGMAATMGDFEKDILKVALTMMSRTDLTAWLGMCANGLSASLLQLVYDAEVFEHARAYLRHFIIDEENLALDIINSVGPGGHFIDQDHTLRHFKKAIWLCERNDALVLSQSGENFIQKAGVKVKEVLSSHSASSLDQNKGELIRIILESARKETTC